MKVKLIVDGGEMKPGPAVAQQLGPLGINLGKLISDVNEATKGFKGMKVPAEVDVNAKTKSYDIKVFSPSVAELIKKELALEKGSGKAKEEKVGNIALERIISIAKTKMNDLLAKDLKAAVRMIVGSCVSLGILVDSKEAKDVENDILEGKYDNEIKNEITEASAEKKKSLELHFASVKETQEKAKKVAEEAAKAAEEAAAAAAVAAGAVPGAAPVAGQVAAAGAAAPGAKVAAAAGAKAPAEAAKAAKPEAKKK
jgi:large subunit ribosomal protein L11